MSAGLRRPAPVLAVVALVAVVAVLASCSSSGGSSSDDGVPFTKPSRTEISRRAGLSFPASTSKFESVKVGDELHVACNVAAADVAAFATGSNLDLVAGKREVIHASPIWELNPAGQVSGAASRSGKIDRSVEVVVDGAVAHLRIILRDA